MELQPDSELLKASPKRSVRLETRPGSASVAETASAPETPRPDAPAGGQRRIVKRFHGPDLLDRIRDRLRARNEYELLDRLHALGLPVPRALDLGRRDGAWEVTTEYLADTRPLDEWLRGRAPSDHVPGDPGPGTRLAADLGRLVARIFAVGLDHRDLHPGNFLVQECPPAPARLWLIDLAKSRLRERVTARQMTRALVQLTAGVRESTPDATRRRFLVTFLAHLPPVLRETLPPRAELGRQLEDEARVFRARDTARRVRRWLRDSSSVEPYDDGRGRGFVRRDLGRGFADEIQAALPPGRWLRGGRIEVAGRSVLIVEAASAAALRSTWERQVRLYTHGLPCLAPLCLAYEPRGWVALEIPPGFDSLEPAESLEHEAAERKPPTDPERRGPWLASLGGLAGALHDRLLDVTEWPAGSLWSDGARAWIGVAPRIAERFDPAPSGPATGPHTCAAARAALEPWTGPLSADECALFRAGYASQLRHSAAERARVLVPAEEGEPA